MKVRAAVLREMGLPAPYAQSRPLAIETVELDPPGPDELLVRVLAAGLCPVDRLLTHTLPLDDINAGFDRLAAGEAVRQAVVF